MLIPSTFFEQFIESIGLGRGLFFVLAVEQTHANQTLEVHAILGLVLERVHQKRAEFALLVLQLFPSRSVETFRQFLQRDVPITAACFVRLFHLVHELFDFAALEGQAVLPLLEMIVAQPNFGWRQISQFSRAISQISRAIFFLDSPHQAAALSFFDGIFARITYFFD